MRVALNSYPTTTPTGLGTLARSMLTAYPDMGHIGWPHPRFDKGLPQRLSEMANRVYQDADCIVALERPLPGNLFALARKEGKKTVLVVMHEWFNKDCEWLPHTDVFICPNAIAERKVRQAFEEKLGTVLKPYIIRALPPLDLSVLPFRQRTEVHTFAYSHGWGGVGARKGWPEVKAALALMTEEERDCLNMNTQTAPEPLQSCGMSVNAIDSTYKESDVAIVPSRCEGLGLCVRSDAWVETEFGPKQMRDVQVGEKILDGHGRFSSVLHIYSRKANSAVELTCSLCRPLVLTTEHQLLTSKHHREAKTHPTSWECAGLLAKGDLVAAGTYLENAPLPQTFDLSTVTGTLHDDDFVWYAMGYSPLAKGVGQIAKEIGKPKRTTELAMKYLKEGQVPARVTQRVESAVDALVAIGWKQARPNRFRRHVELSDDFLEFVGWYIAEGSGSGSNIELSLGEKDKQHRQLFENVAKVNGGIFSWGETFRTGKRRWNWSNSPMTKWLQAECGKGAPNKHIPWFLYRSPSRLLPLVRGLLLGDGGWGSRGIGLTTTSRTLAHQLQVILSFFRLRVSIKMYRCGGLDKYVASVSGLQAVKLAKLLGMKPQFLMEAKTSRLGSSVIDTGKAMLLPVKGSCRIDAEDDFMDFQIEGDSHSFVANGIIVHNSVIEPMALGLPVLTTCAEPMSEYIKDAYGEHAENLMLPIGGSQQILIWGHPVQQSLCDPEWLVRMMRAAKTWPSSLVQQLSLSGHAYVEKMCGHEAAQQLWKEIIR